jgi:hypothetical protein
VKWLTTTPGNENDATIAMWRTSPLEYLVGWNASGTHEVARVAADGTIVEGPVAIAASWGERDDPFRAAGAGVVQWAWFDQAGATQLHYAYMTYSGGCGTL